LADFPEQGRHRSDDAAPRPGRLGLTALVVVVVFFLIGAGGVLAITRLAGGGSTVLPTDPTTPSPSAASVPAGAAGSESASPSPEPTGPQADGVLRFLVTGSTTSGGNLVATVSVTNLSTAWTPFYGENQNAVDAAGNLVPAVTSLTYLEPKEAVSVRLTFRLPAGFRASHLQLRSAPGSAGVTLPLK
jgi:hypothetical protein